MADAGVRVVDTATPGLTAYQKRKQRELRAWMIRSCTAIQRQAKTNLVWKSGPGAQGGLATGALKRSIVYAVDDTPKGLEGQVGTGTKYARYIEGWNSLGEHKPVRKHWLSFFERSGTPRQGLIDWALRHGILHWRTRSAARGRRLAKRFGGMYRYMFDRTGMMVGGPESTTPFLEPSFEGQLPTIKHNLQRIMAS